MCSSDPEILRYVEMPFECIYSERRRKKRSAQVVFNVLQAAHVSKVGYDFQQEMGLKEGEDVLFAVFARSKPDSPEPTASSAICVISISDINNFFRDFIQKGHTRKLHHFPGSEEKSFNQVRGFNQIMHFLQSILANGAQPRENLTSCQPNCLSLSSGHHKSPALLVFFTYPSPFVGSISKSCRSINDTNLTADDSLRACR